MDKFDKVAERMAEVKKQSAEAMVAATLGKAVLDILAKQSSVSALGLIKYFEKAVDSSQSMAGKCSAEQDVDRLCSEAVISRLQNMKNSQSTDRAE